ncbi:MAG: ASKHA domain-containing protein, partial [Anaerolineales bacterium]
MSKVHKVTFENAGTVEVPTGTTLTEAAHLAGISINHPCGGQGRCGRCVVKIKEGNVRRRSSLRLSSKDLGEGYALACTSIIEDDAIIYVPPQEKVERRLVTDLTARKVEIPAGYDYHTQQTIKRIELTIPPPSLEDQTDDWSRLQRSLRQEANIENIQISLPVLRQIGNILRDGDWEVTAIVEVPPEGKKAFPRLLALYPIHFVEDKPLWGVAIDIGTTTVTVWLTNLITGQVYAQAAEYNQQIHHGEDVISRIIYDSKDHNDGILQSLVLETINALIDKVCKRSRAKPEEIFKATVVGNSIMLHLLLNIPASSIRLTPFITAANHMPNITAGELMINIHPEASIQLLPCIASYVGADITAGAYSSGIAHAEKTTLFMDVGTNGEMVLGSQDWLVTCACSAGPAFEGAGVIDGMRATKGAIEEVWINSETYEPTIRVIGGGKPQGLCGSGLISLLS